MTEREKMAQIIAEYLCPQGKAHTKLYGAERMCYSRDNFAECEKVSECVDALIEARIGDVSELKKHRVVVEKSLIPEDDNAYVLPNIPPTVKQLYSGEEVEQIVKEREEYKHRAEVAEKMLNLAVSNYMCTICPCADCDASIYGTQECIEMIIKAYKKQAEKELAAQYGVEVEE